MGGPLRGVRRLLLSQYHPVLQLKEAEGFLQLQCRMIWETSRVPRFSPRLFGVRTDGRTDGQTNKQSQIKILTRLSHACLKI